MSALLLHPNLGAEDERPLAVVDPGLAAALARTWALLFPDDAELESGTRSTTPWLAPGRRAAFAFLDATKGLVPWLSTTAAEDRARALSLPYAAPSPALTAVVSDKAWALLTARELGLVPSSLDGVLTAFSREQLAAANARDLVDERLASWPVSARESFTLKPRFGSSGRGRVKGRGGRLDDAGAAALARLARRGGAVLEPWLSRTEDLSAQLFIDDGGAPLLLGTTRQLTTPSGVWLGNVTRLDDGGALSSGSRYDEELRRAAWQVGERAAREGFRGPLGIDAFAYVDERGEPAFRPLVEVNARYTMGLVTLGLARRAEQLERLRPGQACAFRAHDLDDEGGWERLALPAGALAIGSDYEALSALPARGKPKRR